jgi:hypothetical protein
LGNLGSGGLRVPRQTDPRPLDAFPKINVHRLEASGDLVPGASRIVVAIGTEAQAISLVRLPGTRGGDYALFLCGCGQRRRDLYLKAGCFACRHCHNLDYASRHTWTTPTALLRARRLRQRIGAASLQPFTPLPPRPRWRSASLKHDKLAAEIARCEAAALGALAALNEAADKRRKGMRREQHRHGKCGRVHNA